jgi:hypothetical protein
MSISSAFDVGVEGSVKVTCEVGGCGVTMIGMGEVCGESCVSCVGVLRSI